MKRNLVVFLVAFVVAIPFSGFADVSEKTIDTQDYSMPAGDRSDTTPGVLDGSNTYDRAWDVTYDGTCTATSLDSGNDGSSYEVFAFYTPVAENLDALVTLGTLSDSVMFVYCDPFDPANPDVNLVAWDDDDGDGLASAIIPADGVAIDADTTYFLVIAGYGATALGTYTLDLGGNAVFGAAQQPTPTPEPTMPPDGPQPIPTTSRGGVALMALMLFGAALVLLRRRMA